MSLAGLGQPGAQPLPSTPARKPSVMEPLRRELPGLVALGVGVVLLGSFAHLPAQDLPNHAAITDIILRLWRGEPDISRYYELRPFDFTYRLFYLLQVPLAALLGSVVAARVLIIAMWVAYAGACRQLVRAVRLPPWGVLFMLPWFFGMQLFFGLLSSLLAVVLLLWSVWALTRAAENGSRRYFVVAVVLGVAVGVAHLIVSLLWGASIVAYALGAWRRRWRAASAALALGMLPAIGAVLLRLFDRLPGEPSVLSITYRHAFRNLGWALTANLDPHLGAVVRGTLLAGCLALVANLTWRWARRRAARSASQAWRFLATLVGLWVLCFLLIPANTAGTWGLNLRCVEPVLAVISLLALWTVAELSPRLQQGLRAGVIVVLSLDALLLARAFHTADEVLSGIEPICAAIPHGSTLRVDTRLRPAAGSRFYLAVHAHGYCSVGRLAYDSAIFPDRHIPVIKTPPPELADTPAGHVGAYAFLLVDHESPPPPDGTLVASSGMWKLYRGRGAVAASR